MKPRTIISAALVLALAASCDNMFEPKEEGTVDDSRMWTIPEMVRGVLYDSYSSMPSRPDSFNNNFLDVATDNALTNSFDAGIYRMALGQYTASNCPVSVWSSAYEQFQNINRLLERGLSDGIRFAADDDEDVSIKKSLRGEALYLRGWWGAYLLQFHGGRTADGEALGYPITTEFIDPEADAADTMLKRNTYEECVSRICADLDEAALCLPASATGDYVGRATSLMAEFVKARVLFLAACPAYQPKEIVSLNNGHDYTVVDAVAYAGKWERAALQAAKVIELSGNADYIALKPTDLADLGDNAATPKHYVFRSYYETNNLESRHFPPFYYGKCLSVPSQNLVDAFPMKSNGYPVTASGSGYDPQNPYEGRDDRLAFTVYRHGDRFGDSDTFIDVTPGGKDSEGFMSGGQAGSRSGYYLRKHLSSRANLLEPLAASKSKHFYPSMRMAEMFLDFAEASNEAWGPEVKGTDADGKTLKWSSYDIIKSIRKKSGGIADDKYIEAVKSDKAGFTALILNERRLEFAFENFRFWDLRRRLLPLDEPVRGMTVEKDGDGSLTYAVREIEKRDMGNLRYYYLPVPYDEILKNSDMVNNIGY